MIRKIRKPAIPRPKSSDPGIQRTLEALIEAYEVGEGIRGDLSSTKVTWSDLLKAGVVQARDVNAPALNMSVPPAPVGLEASGAFGVVVLSWGSPFTQYNNHSHTEIWRSESDDFRNAVHIDSSKGVVYGDLIGGVAEHYYWVRFVSAANIKGPMNSTNGTFGKTVEDPQYLMDVLTDEYGSEGVPPFFKIDEDTLIDETLIPAGTYLKSAHVALLTKDNFVGKTIIADDIREAIQSTDFEPSEEGWRIEKDGSAEFHGIIITRPNIVAHGTWINPNEGDTDEATAHFSKDDSGIWGTVQPEDASLVEYDSVNDITHYSHMRGQNALAAHVLIDTEYDDPEEVFSESRGAFVVHAKVTNGHHWHDDPDDAGVIYSAIVQATAATSMDFFTSGADGPPGGRIKLMARIPLPQNIASNVTSIRIDRISWALMRLT